MSELITLSIPFLGTSLGAAMVFFLKDKIAPRIEKLLLGFAAGVMIAASVWSLLIPAIEMTEAQGKLAWLPAVTGFLLGIGFLLVLDTVIPHLHLKSSEPEGLHAGQPRLSKTTMMLFAVTLHNIPEGMSVGVAYAGSMMKGAGITVAGAFALALGIAIQNFPEGAVVSLPLRAAGFRRKKSFIGGVLSGAVEPVAAVLTIFLSEQITPVLPFLLSFAAGAMIYVVVAELIPELHEHEYSDLGTLFFSLGFVVMMILDVALS